MSRCAVRVVVLGERRGGELANAGKQAELQFLAKLANPLIDVTCNVTFALLQVLYETYRVRLRIPC